MRFVRSLPLALVCSISLGCFKAGDDGVGSEGETTDAGDELGTSTQSETESTETGTSSTDTGPACGNGVVEADEQCEGSDLAGQDCKSLGYFAGELACGADCMFDESACQNEPICGNGVVEGSEVCDGADFAGLTCASLADFVRGDLVCGPGCDQVSTLECWSPGEGGSCMSNADCPPEASFCVAGACWNGSLSDPCEFDAECVDSFCVQQECHAGVEGDPCEFNNDCALGFSCYEGVCQDGSLGDGCNFDSECSDEAPYCSNLDGTCQTGQAGSPCIVNSDCASGLCDVPAMTCN